MSKYRIAIAADHAGFERKNQIAEYLKAKGHDVTDFGTFSPQSIDYTDYAYQVTDTLTAGGADFGVLVCGTGIGMSIAANRVSGIRAALCTNAFMAEATRAHNDANILCLAARVNSREEMLPIIDAFFSVQFEGGRHQCRIDKIRNP